MTIEAPPLAENAVRKLTDTLWWWRGKFILKTFNEDKSVTWWAYNKYQGGECKDLAWFSYSLAHLREMMIIMTDVHPFKVVDDLTPVDSDYL